MIHRAKFQNFKALRDVEITFDSRLTVLVGPNGSGKTSVLRALSLLAQVAAGHQAKDVLLDDFTPDLTHSGKAQEPQLLEFVWSPATGVHTTFRLQAVPTTISTGRQWAITSEDGDRKPIPPRPTPNRAPIVVRPGRVVRPGQPVTVKPNIATQNASSKNLPSAMLLQLDPKKIAAPSSITQLPPTTTADGSGAASTLAYLHRREPEKFKQVVNSVKKIIANVNDLKIDYEASAGGARDSLLFDFQGSPDVRASGASTGTLLVVGLFSVLYGPNSPNVILLDDLDYALHPKGQIELVELLHSILGQFPELQIVATAHSPYILDKLQPNEVRVMALRDDGSAACGRIEEHPKYPMWKDSMSPGEFWSFAGEDWVKHLTEKTAQ